MAARTLALVFALLIAAGASAQAHGTGQHPVEPHALDKFAFSAPVSFLDTGVKITTNISVLYHTRTWVQVQVSGAQGVAQASDIIALYAPAASATQPQLKQFVKYKQATAGNPNYLTTGAGTYVFQLLNYRTDMVFALVHSGTTASPVVSAISAPIAVANPNEPTGQHLTLTTDPAQMIISWTTRDVGSPIVQWTADPASLPFFPNTAAGSSTTYGAADLCGGLDQKLGFFDPGTLQSAQMTGLVPATRYWYRVGDAVTLTFGETFTFVSAPLAGPDASVKVIMSADNGQGQPDGSNEAGPQELGALNTTRSIISDIKSLGYTINLHNGDLAYADGYLSDWEQYLDMISGYSSLVPFMTQEGNHERDWTGSNDAFTPTLPAVPATATSGPGCNGTQVCDSRGECGVIYQKRFPMPGTTFAPNASAQGANNGVSWYSYNYGPIHFLSYDSEVPYDVGTPQHAFIAADLAKVDRKVTPWVVVNVHRMVYANSAFGNTTGQANIGNDQTVAIRQRAALESLFYAGGSENHVDAVFYGHEHIYVRTCPVYNFTCFGADQKGYVPAPMYYTNGAAGRSLTAITFTQSYEAQNDITDAFFPLAANQLPVYQSTTSSIYAYTRLTANATHLTTVGVDASTGATFDPMSIIVAVAGRGNTHLRRFSLKLDPGGQEKLPPDQRLSVAHLQRTGELAGDAPECRICLSGERPDALAAACNCIGSMRFAHVSCLETWCEERQSMVCEICGKAYAAPLTAQLMAALERGAARHQREQVVQLMEVDGRATNVGYMSCCGASRARVYVAVLLMFVVTLGLLYVVLFVSGDSQPSVWAVMLLRILAFLLPVYLIVQAVLAYFRFRHAQNARRLQTEGRNAV
ncbi:hypothetical protein WJX81_005574 [Elliptochloris bilobata]|uniref:Purple acid phosphatase n=1 Tax=Elliptochloris bilobata TaxID=381761 RepID=A0AAW1RM95_9CHLO